MADKKLKLLYDGYPAISRIQDSSSMIVHSPFANCQSFCINNTIGLIQLPVATPEYLIELFKEIFNDIGKNQFVIDVAQISEKSIIDRLAFLISYKQAMYYTNTNGTPMVLYLIQLDKDKLK